VSANLLDLSALISPPSSISPLPQAIISQLNGFQADYLERCEGMGRASARLSGMAARVARAAGRLRREQGWREARGQGQGGSLGSSPPQAWLKVGWALHPHSSFATHALPYTRALIRPRNQSHTSMLTRPRTAQEAQPHHHHHQQQQHNQQQQQADVEDAVHMAVQLVERQARSVEGRCEATLGVQAQRLQGLRDKVGWAVCWSGGREGGRAEGGSGKFKCFLGWMR
jgi:hypothetical protein